MRGKTVSGPAGRPSSARRRFSGSRAWALESSSSPAITPEQDADTIIYLASSPEVANVTGWDFIRAKRQGPRPPRAMTRGRRHCGGPAKRLRGRGTEGAANCKHAIPAPAALAAPSRRLYGVYPVTLRMVQKSLARFVLIRYSYGIMKYPERPQPVPQELRTMNCRVGLL
jgi:hypothetical protein